MVLTAAAEVPALLSYVTEGQPVHFFSSCIIYATSFQREGRLSAMPSTRSCCLLLLPASAARHLARLVIPYSTPTPGHRRGLGTSSLTSESNPRSLVLGGKAAPTHFASNFDAAHLLPLLVAACSRVRGWGAVLSHSPGTAASRTQPCCNCRPA